MTDSGVDQKEFTALVNRLAEANRSRRTRIANALSDAAEVAITKSKSHYLTGAALKVQTGRLRSSVTKDPTSGATVSGDSYGVKIGTNVVYGRVWELGGAFKIPAHTRIITKVFGRDVAPTPVHVRAYVRNVKARPFLRPAIRDSLTVMKRMLVAAGGVLSGTAERG
jgi:phage gpG-like protein